VFKFALLFAIAVPLAHAQVVDLAKDRLPITELHGPVRFHTGDDPRWSEPGFDDSQWPLVRIDQPWTAQGFQSDSGLAWYRFQIVVPPGYAHLGLYAPGGVDSYEVFIAGQLVAKYGGMPPTPKFLWRRSYVTPVQPIPDKLIAAGRPVEVALRVWHWPYWTFQAPGLLLPLSIGDAQLLETQRGLRLDSNRDASSGWSFLAVACLLGLCAGVGLFLLRRGEFEYLWFAGGELGMAALAWWNSYPAAHAAEFHIFWTWHSLAILIFDICWPTFLVTFLREPRRRLYWATVGAGILISLTFIPFLFQWISDGAFILLVYLVSIPALVGVLLLVWIPARRGDLDARFLLAPQLLYICANLAQGGIFFLQTTGLYSLASSLQDRFNSILASPFSFSVQSLTDFLMQAAVLAILVLRFARKSRDEQRYKNELEAARTVQQVLVPAENPSIPGFAIESVYRPANEVGGDFFQTVVTGNGGALIVVGDVSGKGMPAAMTVSLLVGTFRTLAHYTERPSEILAAMNQRMLVRSRHGFTTCLVARADSDGTLTIANAGHLAPYRNGDELPLDSALPLGIAPDTDYAESTIQLAPGDTLTFLSDGVVEAQSPSGELFGFERTRDISTQSAESIAAAAQQFGQEDDITVLTLTFAPAELSRA
jgi:Stage II sporulation protein E (SpoIIE)